MFVVVVPEESFTFQLAVSQDATLKSSQQHVKERCEVWKVQLDDNLKNTAGDLSCKVRRFRERSSSIVPSTFTRLLEEKRCHNQAQ